MDRFELPAAFRDFVAATVETETLDAVEMFCLGRLNNTSLHSIVNYVLEIAHVNRHWNKGAHAKVCKAAEAFWKSEGTKPKAKVIVR